MITDYVRRILSARVYDVATVTPLDAMERLGTLLGRAVLLKREDLQPVFSFKLRGAYNRMINLAAAERAAGVICASAGNHAQGVALAAQELGIAAVIVMPVTTPAIKIEAVKRYGAQVVLRGDTFDEARDHAVDLQRERGYTFVHPYDDPDVIAGQGTIGVELLQQHGGPIEAIFVPVGGGGLAAGIAAYVKFLRPEIRVVGVEPVEAASMKAAIDAGERVTLGEVGLFADGVAVARVGAETFALCQALLDEVITVGTDAICAAIKDIFEDTRVLTEPAGALALAGLKHYVARETEARPAQEAGALIAIASGANVNFDRMRHIAERAELGEAREILLGVTIPERQGSYRAFVDALGSRVITEFNYRYTGGPDAHVFVGLQLQDAAREKASIVAALEDRGYRVLDMSADETAKVHIRYMIGGRTPGLSDEVLVRCEFPERPGALGAFLEGVASDWSITLFHYRNHGADRGRVLAGLNVAQEDRPRFDARLRSLSFPFAYETDNPAYRLYLHGQDPLG